MVFSIYYLMYGRQPQLLVDVTLGLASHTITEPYTLNFIQKMREHTKWAQSKAEAFQAKEVQRHKEIMIKEIEQWPWKSETWS